VVGIMVVIDLSYGRIPLTAYLSAALATVALGLFIGTWFGRARGLIAFGIVLSLALGSAAGASEFDGPWRGGTITYAPTSVSQLEGGYSQDVGDVSIDLSDVDFSTQTTPVTLDVDVHVGSVEIHLPPNVDVVVDAEVHAGNADVLGQNWSGVGLDPRSVSDDGADGKGGGELHISAQVNLGNLEVSR
jgi:hypothetical protein